MLTPSPPPTEQVAPAAPNAAQLSRLIEGLLFISESEAPLHVVQLPPAPDLAAAIHAVPALAGLPLREQPLEEIFFERVAPSEGSGDIDIRQAPAYAALLAWLRTHVRDARAVRVGAGAPQELYLIGRTPDGGWLGVRTTTVDT